MRVKTILFVALLSIGGFAFGQNYPKADISNGVIQAELMLPDPQHGSYQGTRFDWSGIIFSLQYQGHEYFGKWYEKHDPKIHDAITGPVEEFRTNDSGLGYEEAKAGGTFVRIGVGTVRKPEEKAYRPYDTYEIVDPGKWTVKRHKNSIEFTHRLKGENGYAYVYRKTVRLVKGKPELVLEHWLKNTGQKAIDTTQYNHNFYEGLYESKPLSFKKGSWTFFTYHQLKLDKRSQITLNGFIRIKGQQQFYELSNFGALNTSFNRQFMKQKQLIVTLSMNDIFYTNQNDFSIQQGSVKANGNRKSDTQRFGINIRYNFGIRKKEETNDMFNVEPQERN